MTANEENVLICLRLKKLLSIFTVATAVGFDKSRRKQMLRLFINNTFSASIQRERWFDCERNAYATNKANQGMTHSPQAN